MIETLAIVGWVAAVVLACVCWYFMRAMRLTQSSPHPTKLVMLNLAGLPESCRRLRVSDASAAAIYRSHGRGRTMKYARVGTAIVFQATDYAATAEPERIRASGE